MPRPGSDRHDRHVRTHVFHGVVEHNFRILYPTVGSKWPRAHPEHPRWKDPVARQKLEHRERVMQALVPAREQKDTHTLESFGQPACALEIQRLIRLRVPRLT